jgi:hypothetical protein
VGATAGEPVGQTGRMSAPRLLAGRPQRSTSQAPAPWVAVVVLGWIPAVLLLDRGASMSGQLWLGAGTWVLLVELLRRQTALVRAQTAVVVAFATAVEYTFSPLLHVYVYRLHDVPAFVPPGHGLVYLAAFAIGGSRWVRAHMRVAVGATVVAGGAYAAWGLSPMAPRPDVLGAFWYVCLLGFLVFGSSRSLYAGAFLVVTYLELLGTHLGSWTWAAHDPTGLVAMGNPPSGAAGGYGWFDLAAVLAAPALLVVSGRVRGVLTRRPPAPAAALAAEAEVS